MRAARRSGSANTKTKAEVNFSGAKPWRQKGTGRARAGYKSSVIWRGGGVVFGPKPRDYSKKVSKTVRRLAFQKALSERINAGDVLTVDAFSVKEPKTKAFVSLVKGHTDAKKVLLISDSFEENVLPLGAQRETGPARDRDRREHRATPRLRQDHRDRQGARAAGRKDVRLEQGHGVI